MKDSSSVLSVVVPIPSDTIPCQPSPGASWNSPPSIPPSAIIDPPTPSVPLTTPPLPPEPLGLGELKPRKLSPLPCPPKSPIGPPPPPPPPEGVVGVTDGFSSPPSLSFPPFSSEGTEKVCSSPTTSGEAFETARQ